MELEPEPEDVENEIDSNGADITLQEIALNSNSSDQENQIAKNPLLHPDADVPVKPEIEHNILTSEIAIDQTWGEWMQELPGSTWNKLQQFASCQWKWSKCLVNYTYLPEWLKDNQFLLSRHRLPIYSFTGCFFSAFRLHSETGNIWTHLIGSLATISLAIYCFATRLHMLPWTEQIVYAVFFLTASLCMGFSCMFHTVTNHSPKMFKLFSRLDYSGISLLCVGSYAPWLYYAEFCYPLTYVTYMSAVCVISLTGTVVTLWEEFDKPKYRIFRAAVFLTMGLSAVVPGVHYSIKFGWNTAIEQASLGWMILMGCFYVSGTTFYMLQVPERFFPGKCDLCFQSHQIMHIFVFIAVFVHYHGVSQLEYRHTAARFNNTLCSNNILNITSWS